jgi:MFS family permease
MPRTRMSNERYVWRRELSRYHWFVLVVAALGWLFDTMDQQLFNLARVPAMRELLASSPGAVPDAGDVATYGGYATSIFLIGWASGGLFFGMLGDRVGRAKTMVLTILVYSMCTGLSAFSQGIWDFATYRFLTGLGVGGEFAVGVALVAEVMPTRARPYALGLLQALSTVGNVTAALISIGLGHLEETGVLGSWQIFGITLTAWRTMFLVGTVPALLALVIRRRLKEPEQWQEAARHADGGVKLGSYAELFGDPRWRRRSIVGLLLATSGVIGLWGIAFFSIDLNRSVLRKVFEQDVRDANQATWDRDFVRLAMRDPSALTSWAARVKPIDLVNSSAEHADAQPLLSAMLGLQSAGRPVTADAVLTLLDGQGQAAKERSRRAEYLAGEPVVANGEKLAADIAARSTTLNGKLTRWIGYTSMMLNIGGFFGIYSFSLVTQRIGRRPMFAIAFLAAALSTILVFWQLNDVTDIFWMVPLMGFCQLSLFGGYAIYFPELFPTRLRSTGTSFCYNVGRFLAAAGPSALGLLTSRVFAGSPEPLRWAGITMCSVFLIGLVALPFAPETKDQPLPE